MMRTEAQIISGIDIRLTSLEISILRKLLYFDIFRHPLKAQEIASYCSTGPEGIESIRQALNSLAGSGLIQCWNGYYFISGDHKNVSRRIEGEKYAEESLRKAKYFSGIISKFPFVRGICLSGSISKLYMDKDADIDYFVITTPGRMWLSRTLLVLFKKIVLLNKKKYFCINYFITEDTLSIPHQNIFTATELAFLIPTYNTELYQSLMMNNSWYRNHYPKFPLRDGKWMAGEEKKIIKPVLENLLNGAIGEKLDAFCFRLTLRFWKKKFKTFSEDTFDLRLRSRKNESKHHPLGYQEKVLSAFENKIKKFELEHSIRLNT